MPTIRKAELRDVPAIFQLINQYVPERVVLPRTLGELYESVWEFTVAEEDGKVLACGALKLYSEEMAEIRSLCVARGVQKGGLGRAITENLLGEAERLQLKTVFALAVAPGFFEKRGFREVARATLPMKVWRDCVHCEKYFQCDERALVIDLPHQPASDVASRKEVMEVPV